MIDKADMFSFEEKHYCLFSKGGFTDAAKRKASESIMLIDFHNMSERTFCTDTE